MLTLLIAAALADPPRTEAPNTESPRTEAAATAVPAITADAAPSVPAVVVVEEAPAPVTGSLAVPIPALSSRVWVDGQALTYVGTHDAFVAVGLTPGEHTVRIEKDGKLRFEGPVQVSGAVHQRCVPGLGTITCTALGAALEKTQDPLSPSPTW